MASGAFTPLKIGDRVAWGEHWAEERGDGIGEVIATGIVDGGVPVAIVKFGEGSVRLYGWDRYAVTVID